MIEIIVIALSVVFILLPIMASGSTYKESFIMGNCIFLLLAVFMFVAIVITISVFHVFFDGISLTDAALKVYNDLV